MVLKVYTGQVGRYHGADALDVTIKSSRGLGQAFAPTDWNMVMGVKRGRVSHDEYKKWYLGILRESYKKNKRQWQELLGMERVVLLCYCRPGQFCHRLILAEVLGKLGAEMRGEVTG